MRRELAAFLDYCRLERRLAPLTCSAYERDVGACLAFAMSLPEVGARASKIQCFPCSWRIPS
ncbi:MAG: hypothetical protein ACRDH5_10145, partial [bacterium]